ncbi:MAG: M15 family metallopeptidase [Bacilli bacterium]
MKTNKKKKSKTLQVIFSLCLIGVLASGMKQIDFQSVIDAADQHLILEEAKKEKLPWNLTLVNRWNPVPSDAAPELMKLANGEQIDKRIYKDLQRMFDDARSEGVYPLVTSGYRTNETQQQIMEEKIQAYMNEGHSRAQSEELAESWVALPGTSEHQLGLGLDINADKQISTNEIVYNWLHNNSYKYGFVLRYPKSKTNITGISYEPWHFRYVGEAVAYEMYEADLCLEEYLEIR